MFFHAFTGCDTTSAFKGIGKKKSYEALKAYTEIETIFADIHAHPFPDLNENDSRFEKIERFVILMYSRTSIVTSVNEARMNMYFSKTQNIENIPPTKNALLSTLSGLFFKVVFGIDVLVLNKIFHYLKILDGKKVTIQS